MPVVGERENKVGAWFTVLWLKLLLRVFIVGDWGWSDNRDQLQMGTKKAGDECGEGHTAISYAVGGFSAM